MQVHTASTAAVAAQWLVRILQLFVTFSVVYASALSTDSNMTIDWFSAENQLQNHTGEVELF
jgi:hypothetical protein